MKKSVTLIFLFISTLIVLITVACHCYVSGNTFKMPPANKKSNPYHVYKIDNNADRDIYRDNKKTKKNYYENSNINNSYNTNYNIKSNNNSNNKNNKIKQKKYSNKNKDSNISYTNKKTKQDYNKTNNYPVNKTVFKKQNSNIIKKIEFKKHFIKIKAGSSQNILFTTVPAQFPYTGLIYKSNNNSIAVYKNNKLTGVKKGFTTILIMLQNGTVKAACPVKVI